MAKLRVYQLAKELEVQSALILELLDRMGREVKSDLSVLDPGIAEEVRARVSTALTAEKERLAREQEVAKLAEAEAAASAPHDPAAGELPEEPTAGEPAVEVPAVEVPDGEEPGVRVPAAAAPPSAEPSAPVPASAAGPAPAKPVAPSARRPRVFPAQRVPSPGLFKPPRPAPGAPLGARGPAGRPAPGAPLRPGMPPGRSFPPRKRRKKDKKKEQVTPLISTKPKPELPPVPEEITLSEGVTVKELAEKLNRKSKDVIAKLIPRGVLATINQPLEPAMAIEVAKEFGSTAEIMSFEEEASLGAQRAKAGDEIPTEQDRPEDLLVRPPVVTVMGHVDHGKTSLLDALRTTTVAEGEAGGITQHIGAYQVEEKGRKITFLDTPGHEAFTLMRARGAKATDIVILVVAADDGVKPQTVEAIDHARAAAVPMVVAINKVDKPGADAARIKQQLADREVMVEEYGGEVVCCEVSAKQRTGLDNLLEMILLVADLKELKANPNKPAAGVVLETRRDRSRGVMATVLVQEGTLKTGDAFIAGLANGKVRAMTDERAQRVVSAGPATPVEVMGFAAEPASGDRLQAVADESKARQIVSFRQDKLRAEKQKQTAARTLESFSHSENKELSILLKTDVHGSIEAIQKALADLPSDKVKVNVLRASIGAISQADVLLAAASNLIVVGFNVRPDKAAADLARREGVELRMYTVIYDLIDDIRQAMVGLLEPTLREQVLGQAEVRQLFKVPKIGIIAGCYVGEGKVTRNAEVRLLRDNTVIHTGRVSSLRRFKDDAAEVKQGYECGIGIQDYNDLKEGDVIEFFVMEKIAAVSL